MPGPVIIQKPSPNFGYPNAGDHGRNGESIVAIVDHIMAGTLAGADSWFAQSQSQVSAHFGVGKDGSIHQYVAEGDAAWGAGALNKPDGTLPWLPADGPGRGRKVNCRVISIEHEGQSGEPFTAAQLTATLALHRMLIARYGIPVDRDHIVGHYRLDSVNRASCPGGGFPWDELFEALVPNGMTAAQQALLSAAMDQAWAVKTQLEAAGNAASVTVFDAIVAFKVWVGLQAPEGGVASIPPAHS